VIVRELGRFLEVGGDDCDGGISGVNGGSVDVRGSCSVGKIDMPRSILGNQLRSSFRNIFFSLHWQILRLERRVY
jgi:hypothetical protein